MYQSWAGKRLPLALIVSHSDVVYKRDRGQDVSRKTRSLTGGKPNVGNDADFLGVHLDLIFCPRHGYPTTETRQRITDSSDASHRLLL